MAEYIYTMRKTRKAHGDKVILDDVTLSFLPGAKIGVVGPNGAGKSTVLKIMAGLEQPSNGDAFLTPGFSVGILMQEPELDETKTVLENVQDGAAEIMGKLNRFNEVAELMATDYSDALMDEMGKLQEDLDHANAWDLDGQLEQAMDALGCPPGDWPVVNLSGGEKRRVALCKLLIEAPDLLLLDEPTNHLDAESVNWLEQHLTKYAGAVVAVTHDRYFLNNVAEWILELDRGRAIPYEGNYSTYLDKKSARLKVEGRKDEKRQKRLKEELEWVRSNAKGRQTKSKARLARYEEMAAEADKMRKLDFEEIQIPPGPRLGSIVVEVQSLSKAFGDKVLIDDLSFTLPRNGIVGVIGPNGAGKTTLFKMIQGLETPDSGSIKVGDTVKISYVDQSRANIDPKKSLWAVVSDELDYINVGQVEMPSRAYVSAFGFKGPDQQKPAGVLSGGERNRLNLALTLKEGGNLLLLDEPTNDLDVETLVVAGERAARVPRCGRGHLPRPLVPGPGRDAHPRVRGRVEVVLVRGQLRVVREEQGRATRCGRGSSAPCHLQEADPGLIFLRHIYRCPLRWADMDAYGHVNNVVFLRYLEEARIDFLFRPEKDFKQGSVVSRHEIDYKRQLVHRHTPWTSSCGSRRSGRRPSPSPTR